MLVFRWAFESKGFAAQLRHLAVASWPSRRDPDEKEEKPFGGFVRLSSVYTERDEWRTPANVARGRFDRPQLGMRAVAICDPPRALACAYRV